jgi:hypothetical protein
MPAKSSRREGEYHSDYKRKDKKEYGGRKSESRRHDGDAKRHDGDSKRASYKKDDWRQFFDPQADGAGKEKKKKKNKE